MLDFVSALLMGGVPTSHPVTYPRRVRVAQCAATQPEWRSEGSSRSRLTSEAQAVSLPPSWPVHTCQRLAQTPSSCRTSARRASLALRSGAADLCEAVCSSFCERAGECSSCSDSCSAVTRFKTCGRACVH